MDFKQFFKRWLMIAVGVIIASNTATGIHYDSVESLVFAVLLLSVLNVFLKPLLMLFSLPFIILTLGLGVWVINALLFLFVSEVVAGFQVDTFTSALWGALLVSVISTMANLLFAKPGKGRVNIRFNRTRPPPSHRAADVEPRGRRRSIKDDEDVIDI